MRTYTIHIVIFKIPIYQCCEMYLKFSPTSLELLIAVFD